MTRYFPTLWSWLTAQAVVARLTPTTPAPRRVAAWAVLLGLLCTGGNALAVGRSIEVSAPRGAVAGDTIDVTITARTDVGGGEQIGFLHADYSVDGGATWVGIAYEENIGAYNSRSLTIVTGAAGTKCLVRVRVAFRGGKAGDVDLTGKPIAWETSWTKWEQPPAKIASVAIRAK